MENAYLPNKLKTCVLSDDYQRIANEIRDGGDKITWEGCRPMINGIDVSVRFMYPTIFYFPTSMKSDS